ncbi:MAG: FHA domain-containing protein [Acidimicrobiales bacterium]
MPESLLTLLKLLLLALLYLFFARVLHSVWSELKRSSTDSAPAGSGAGESGAAPIGNAIPVEGNKKWKRHRTPDRLVVVAPVEHKGRIYMLGPEQTVGRSPGCQVALDDTYASQVHARIFEGGQGYFIEDLGSTNGTYLNDQKVTSPMPLGLGDRLKIGGTELEISG